MFKQLQLTHSMNMGHLFFFVKVPEYFNTSQSPTAASLPQSQYSMHGIPVNTAPYINPSIAPYINPSMSNSITTQFMPNGNCYWQTPQPVVQYNAMQPFHNQSPPVPHLNPNLQQNTQPKRIDPRLLPRHEFHPQRSPQSFPIQKRPGADQNRYRPLINQPNVLQTTAKQRITYADYKRSKEQLNQSNDANMAKNKIDASKRCDDTHNGNKANLAFENDSIRPSNHVDDDASNEPTFSPTVSESDPNSPASVTPPNELVPNDDSYDVRNDRSTNNQSNIVAASSPKIKHEFPPISCASDESTDDDYDSDSTVEFTPEALRREHGLSVPMPNRTTAVENSPSKF